MRDRRGPLPVVPSVLQVCFQLGTLSLSKTCFRCPASNDCTGIPQSEYKSSRLPEDNFPLDLEMKGRSALARAMNISMRVERDTPEGCCSGEVNRDDRRYYGGVCTCNEGTQ